MTSTLRKRLFYIGGFVIVTIATTAVIALVYGLVQAFMRAVLEIR